MRPIPLAARTKRILAFIRGNRFPLSVYGRSAGRVAPMVRDLVRQDINRFGVSVAHANLYVRYTAEMLKAFRTLTGSPLADRLLLAIRKWADFGCDPDLLQQLLCDCHDKFHQTGHQAPPQKELKPRPRPGRTTRRTYQRALKQNRRLRSRVLSTEEQSARHRAGTRHAADIGRRLKPVLAAAGIPGKSFVRYFAFAQKLGRFSRNYSGASLAKAAADLVDLYEAKGLARRTLLAIARDVFGITPP